MESPITQSGASSSRRDFFKRAGLGVGVLASASALQACDSNDDDGGDADVVLDFSSDVGVLNYAYALEQLEAAFYATVVSDSAFTSTFSNTTEQAALRDIAKHEAVHAAFFKAAITGAAGASAVIPGLTPKFSSIDFKSRTSVLQTAQVFEDLGVGAYNGAGQYIRDTGYLLIAGKIVSVEARHASVISGLISTNSISGSGQIDSNALDKALAPATVLASAGAYIEESIGVINIPTTA